MKKILKNVLATVCALTFVIGVTACEKGADSALTAYEIAVKNGFEGTEKEWLLSLKGADGTDAEDLDVNDFYNLAKENGYDGTLLQFMQEVLDVEVQEDNDTRTIAQNMMSVVSIYSGFSKTKQGWNGVSKKEYYTSAGSGVIIDMEKDRGYALVVTNYHVIYDSASDSGISECIYLYGYGALSLFSADELEGDVGGDGMKATYVGGAMDYDVALLKVEGNEILQNGAFMQAEIGSSEEIKAGEKVFAIGNPDAAGISVTEGLISVTSEYITMTATDNASREVEYRVMRTDAAINGGNSGGGLFNTRGQLIGITNAKTVSEDIDNMAYALPITEVTALCDNIRDNGGVLKRAVLGVDVLKNASKAVFNEDGTLDVVEEFFVERKAPLGSAAYGKLYYGDIFRSIKIVPQGESAENCEEITLDAIYLLEDTLLQVRLGDTVILGMTRSGEEITVEIEYNQESYFTVYS